MAKQETIDALERGLAVIQLFRETGERLTISEVAEGIAQSRAVARRNLLTLAKLGYATLEGRHFVLTPKLLELSSAYLHTNPLTAKSQTALAELANETGEAASLTVLDGGDIVYVARAQPCRPVRSYISVGSRFPAHLTSSGRVLLSGLHYNRLNDHLRAAELRPWTERTITCESQLRSFLRETAFRGWCAVRGEIEETVAGISLPITSPDGRMRAALNLGSVTDRATEGQIAETYLPAMRRTVRRIESTIAR